MANAKKIEIAKGLTGTPVEQLERLISFAIMAPSSHNTQPWLFRVRGDALEIFADRTRRLPVCDPDDRELTMSCGAALEHAVLAARHFGHGVEVSLLPDPRNPDLLGRLRLKDGLGTNADIERHFAAIPNRRTTRVTFAANGLDDRMTRKLGLLAEGHGVEARIVSSPLQREALAEIVARADRRQIGNPAFRAELSKWMRRTTNEAKDGMSIASFGMSDIFSPAAAALLRTFDLGANVSARDHQLASGSPALMLLSTANDDEDAWMRTGAALSEIMLEATANDIRTAFLNQPIELPDLRAELRGLVGVNGHPQLLLRLGRGPEVPASARRELRMVLGS